MHGHKNKITKIIIYCILVVIISIIVRVLFIKDWLNYDECQHFLIAKSPFIDNFLRETFIRIHPPLTYAFMKPFVWFGSSPYLVKMLSLLSGVLSVVIVYIILIRQNISAFIASTGAIFIGMVPVFVTQSIEAREYSLFSGNLQTNFLKSIIKQIFTPILMGPMLSLINLTKSTKRIYS